MTDHPTDVPLTHFAALPAALRRSHSAASCTLRGLMRCAAQPQRLAVYGCAGGRGGGDSQRRTAACRLLHVARCAVQETELAANDPEKFQDIIYQWRNATQRSVCDALPPARPLLPLAWGAGGARTVPLRGKEEACMPTCVKAE